MKYNLVLDIINLIKEHAPPGYQQDEQDFESDWLPHCEVIKTLYLTWTKMLDGMPTYTAKIDIDLHDRTSTMYVRNDNEEAAAFASFHDKLESLLRRE